MTAITEGPHARLAIAEAFIRNNGYRPCDIPACNCGSWHGGHAVARLSEIYELLGERTQGRTAWTVISDMVGELDRLCPIVEAARAVERAQSAIEKGQSNDFWREWSDCQISMIDIIRAANAQEQTDD